jgi:hypothetical protein
MIGATSSGRCFIASMASLRRATSSLRRQATRPMTATSSPRRVRVVKMISRPRHHFPVPCSSSRSADASGHSSRSRAAQRRAVGLLSVKLRDQTHAVPPCFRSSLSTASVSAFLDKRHSLSNLPPRLESGGNFFQRQHDRGPAPLDNSAGMPNTTAVFSDSAMVRPPRFLISVEGVGAVIAHAGQHHRYDPAGSQCSRMERRAVQPRDARERSCSPAWPAPSSFRRAG